MALARILRSIDRSIDPARPPAAAKTVRVTMRRCTIVAREDYTGVMSDPEPEEMETTLAGVPALIASVGPRSAAAQRGTILLLHGLTASKEAQRTEAHSLARCGYLAVTVDAVGHGARRYHDFDHRFGLDRGERSFFDVVQQSADEVPAVLDALVQLDCGLPGRVGACGISMGGFILFGAIAARCRLDAVATIVASPRWLHCAVSPHRQLDRFFPTALLMQNASDDVVVSPSQARDLHDELRPRYASAPESLRYVEYPGEQHMLSAQAWQRAWGEVIDWFDLFLSGSRTIEPQAHGNDRVRAR